MPQSDSVTSVRAPATSVRQLLKRLSTVDSSQTWSLDQALDVAKALIAQLRANAPDSPMTFGLTARERQASIAAALAGGPFTQVPLKAEQASRTPYLQNLRGVLAAGPGVDVLWGQKDLSSLGVFLMKEKG